MAYFVITPKVTCGFGETFGLGLGCRPRPYFGVFPGGFSEFAGVQNWGQDGFTLKPTGSLGVTSEEGFAKVAVPC
jgi:hypothetical protein